MLLELNSILFTLVAVIVGHVEPVRALKKKKKKLGITKAYLLQRLINCILHILADLMTSVTYS